MGWWSERVLPHCVERSLSSTAVMELRRAVCRDLTGRVLEIGFGSGLNLTSYPASVTAVDAVEPSDLAWELSARRRAASPVPVRRTGLDGEQVDAPAESYDAVLSTFTLCTVPRAADALAEVHRVLRPGGALHALEHGLSPDPGVARWQRRLEPLQRRVAGGCHLTREVPRLVADAGLRVDRLEQGYLPGPALQRPWGYGSLVVASRR